MHVANLPCRSLIGDIARLISSKKTYYLRGVLDFIKYTMIRRLMLDARKQLDDKWRKRVEMQNLNRIEGDFQESDTVQAPSTKKSLTVDTSL